MFLCGQFICYLSESAAHRVKKLFRGWKDWIVLGGHETTRPSWSCSFRLQRSFQSFQKADMHLQRMAMATSAVLLKTISEVQRLVSQLFWRFIAAAVHMPRNSECPTAKPPRGHLGARWCQHMPTIKVSNDNTSAALGAPLPSSHSFEDGPRSTDVQLAGEILDQGCQNDLPMGSESTATLTVPTCNGSWSSMMVHALVALNISIYIM